MMFGSESYFSDMDEEEESGTEIKSESNEDEDFLNGLHFQRRSLCNSLFIFNCFTYWL